MMAGMRYERFPKTRRARAVKAVVDLAALLLALAVVIPILVFLTALLSLSGGPP